MRYWQGFLGLDPPRTNTPLVDVLISPAHDPANLVFVQREFEARGLEWITSTSRKIRHESLIP